MIFIRVLRFTLLYVLGTFVYGVMTNAFTVREWSEPDWKKVRVLLFSAVDLPLFARVAMVTNKLRYHQV